MALMGIRRIRSASFTGQLATESGQQGVHRITYTVCKSGLLLHVAR